MARRCTVCEHTDRAAIDAALVGGASIRDVAGQYDLSRSSVDRHKRDHIPAHLAKAQEAAEVAQADDLLKQLRGLRNKAVSILLKAEQQGDLRTALAGIREARACLELLAEMEGELDRRATVNIVTSPEWLQIQAVIVQAVAPYPEARAAIADALCEIEDGA